jgi:hypothetical protein
MNDHGNAILNENESGEILLEDGTGTLLLESAPLPISFNNYEFVRADSGISVTEKIR